MDEERKEVIQEFFRIYRKLQEKYSLRMHTHFDLFHDGLIEIWEYSGETKGKCICKVTGETEIECYRSAIGDLKYYENSRRDKVIRNAG